MTKNYDYRPSIESSKAQLSGVRVDSGRYPAGAKGPKFSLDEVARRIRDGRNDVFVKSWAGKVLLAAGKPSTNVGKAQAILDAVRKQTVYVQDPVGTEMIVASRYTLCLDGKLCMPAGDCDDLTVATGSAIMSMGVPVQVVGQSFKGFTEHPTHVLLAIDTPDGWKRVDPSSPTMAVGEAFPATREWTVDPLKKSEAEEVSDTAKGLNGDYVGIGARPDVFGLGNLPYPNLVGVGDGIVSGATYDAITAQLQTIVMVLEAAVNRLGAALVQVQQTRAQLQPETAYDPEPYAIDSIADFPTNGIWTQSMQYVATQLWTVGSTLVQAGHDALDGARQVLVDQNTNEAYVAAAAADPWSLHSIVERAEDAIYAFFNPAGTIISGFSAKDGKALSAAQVQAEASSTGSTGVQGVGVGSPIIWVGAIVAVTAIAGFTAYFVMSKYCDSATAAAREATNKAIVDCINSGRCSQQQGQALLSAVSQNRIAELKAQKDTEESNPFSSALGSVEKTVLWVVVGGLAFASVYTFFPLLKAVAEGSAASYKRSHPA